MVNLTTTQTAGWQKVFVINIILWFESLNEKVQNTIQREMCAKFNRLMELGKSQLIAKGASRGSNFAAI